MKIAELRTLKPEELNEKLTSLRAELRTERGKISMGAAQALGGKVRNIKRDISKILTLQKEAKLGIHQEKEGKKMTPKPKKKTSKPKKTAKKSSKNVKKEDTSKKVSDGKK